MSLVAYGCWNWQQLQVDGPNATLPRERPKRDEDDLEWVAGALDGVAGHHLSRADVDQNQNRTKPVLRALARLLKHSSQEDLSLPHSQLEKDSPHEAT